MPRSRRHRSKTSRWFKAHLPKLLLALLASAALAGGIYFASRKSPEDHLRAGITLQQKGDLKGAAIELKNALQAMPNNAEARLRLGQVHFANGDYAAAEKELKHALDLGVRDAGLLPLYGRALLHLGEPQRLLDEVPITQGIGADTHAAILALRAQAYLQLKDPEAAKRNLQQAEALMPQHPEVLATRALLALNDQDQDQALVLLDKALAQAPERADYWLYKSTLLRRAKRDEAALEALSKAVTADPSNIDVRRARAQLYIETAALDKATADLEALRKQAPNDVVGRYLQALIAFKQSRHAEANTLLQGILKGAPGFLPAHLLAGTVNIALGNREAARFHLDKVLGAAPNHPLARKLMAATLTDLGDLKQAKALLSSFGKADDDALLHTLQGQIALREGNYAEARKHLEQVQGAAAHNARYFMDLAASRLGSGDTAGAVEALGKAAELDGQSNRPEILLVLTHLKEKRYAEALQVADALEKKHPNDPLSHNLRGAIHLQQNDLARARASFSKALDIKPDYFPAASNLAMLDLRNKDMQAARARFEQLLQHNPKEERAWLALAAFAAQAGDESGYLKHLEAARKANDKALQPRVLLARYWLSKNDPARALVEARTALDATGRAEFLELIGLALSAQGDHANALATFKQWAEKSPTNPLAFFRLAQAQSASQDRAGALQSLDKALALRPEFAEAAFSKALLLGQMGRGEEGMQIARKLQTSQPKAAGGYVAEAEILLGQKRYLDAARQFAKAAQLSGSGPLLIRAHQVFVQGGQGSEGEKLMSQWLLTKPNDAVVRHYLALSQLQARRWQEAASNYRILVQANPKDSTALNNLAWVLGEMGDKDAVGMAEQALKLAPDNPATLDTAGWILLNAGNTKRGLDLLQQAHAKAPTAAEIHWHFARALAKAGDRQRARQELEKLLTSGQDFPQKAEAKKFLQDL